MEQSFFDNKNNYESIDCWVNDNHITRLFVVCGNTFKHLTGISNKIYELEDKGIEIIFFSDYSPNPVYESVVNGVDLFKKSHADGIIAIGGGSAMDVAKCIKIYSSMVNTPFMAIPTTAGTGSESTKFAVYYKDGVKQGLTDERCIPDAVLFDHGVLKALPMYQRKATMCDALCHGIESFWSVNSTDESKEYSALAIKEILKNMDGYLNNTDEGNEGMLKASNIAGQAINIAQTTAGHAMCYKITSLFGISHGHAAMLCDRVLFPEMLKNTDKCIDVRGEDYLKTLFDEISNAFGVEKIEDAVRKFDEIFEKLELDIPVASDGELNELACSVNAERLKNHPLKLNEDGLRELYKQILKVERI